MTSSRDDIIGIDIAIISIFPPNSILLAIAASPESLHILVAYSVNIAIPVILSNILKNWLSILALLAKFVSKFMTPVNLSSTKNNIIAPANIEIYTANSGLYCFKIIIIINPTNPNPYNFYNIHTNFSFIG